MCLGIPGQIRKIYEHHGLRMAIVDFGGIGKEVCLAYLPEAVVGEYALIHAGFAITLVDQESARETLQMFLEMGELEDLAG
mgnify:CR=1 FL=1